jgi:hypothetical protein
MFRSLRAACLIGLTVLAWPGTASANFVWPPMVYLYSYTLWWVVLPGLIIEALVYSVAFRKSWRMTAGFTIVVNAASAACGSLLVIFSMVFVVSPVAMIGFIWASPLLIFGVTVVAEYAAGVHFFDLPRSRRNATAIAIANAPSVAWASSPRSI